MTPLFLAAVIVALVAAVLIVRRQWLAYAQQLYLFKLSWFILARKLPDDTIVSAIPTLKRWRMQLDIARWDFGRYVDYALFHEVEEFFSDEANLIDLPRLQREKLERDERELNELVKGAMAEQGLTEETLGLEEGALGAALDMASEMHEPASPEEKDRLMCDAMAEHGITREQLERDLLELRPTEDDINRELLAAAELDSQSPRDNSSNGA